VQNLEVVGLDFAQQGAVDAGHHQAGLLGAAVGGGQQGQGLVVQGMGPRSLKTHQCHKPVGVGALEDFMGLHVKLLQLIYWHSYL
jgi:hypothetical protein